ncbi:MAG: indole-3-glycerol phosphate synthase TrpC [Chlorobi bacterium]|nr:indole-3-glycerol phosphate synthase TrpC [Chlorobiota bacterium]
MNILEKIARYKVREVKERKKTLPGEKLREIPGFDRPVRSLSAALLDKDASGIIAEFKRRSPSKGDFHPNAQAEKIIPAYESAGASACSILTDEPFFGGSLRDISGVRTLVNLPVLRKDFIIDPYQVFETKAAGADAILLIAAILEKKRIIYFSQLAADLGLETLLEIHDESELQKIVSGVSLIGINNRNLKTFRVDIRTSLTLGPQIPEPFPKVAESGISGVENIQTLHKAGFRGFLIGEYFMQSENPAARCKELVNQLKA